MESSRKRAIREWADRAAGERDRWIERNAYYHGEDHGYLRFLIPPGRRVLDLGCGTGGLLASLAPSRGVGVDLSPAMVEVARRRHPGLEFHGGDAEDAGVLDGVGGPFDVVLLSDTVGFLDDCETTLRQLHRCCDADTRVVIAYYSRLWSPLLHLAERAGRRMRQPEDNWLSADDLAALLHLADYEVVRLDHRLVLPTRLGGLGPLANRYVGTLPGISRLALRSYLVARPVAAALPRRPSATVVIPCRNEAGNVAAAIERIPPFCDDIEVIFVEGHSRDDTLGEIKRVIDANPDRDIKVLQQPGKGKGDAVRTGFEAARGDVLMILDADLTMPPEELPKFYDALVSGKGELVMGTRLVYPMEDDAMRLLNVVGNKVFSLLFTWLLDQRITDTLCGTKVLWRRHYEQVSAGRAHFGNFDPFGDFDLIFGAVKLNLRIVEIPVRYRARTYGTTQISRFRDGLLLLRMVAVAYRKLKAVDTGPPPKV